MRFFQFQVSRECLSGIARAAASLGAECICPVATVDHFVG